MDASIQGKRRLSNLSEQISGSDQSIQSIPWGTFILDPPSEVTLYYGIQGEHAGIAVQYN